MISARQRLSIILKTCTSKIDAIEEIMRPQETNSDEILTERALDESYSIFMNYGRESRLKLKSGHYSVPERGILE